jgi:uncharacterized membrane protein YcaP (DUF421 family)
LVVFVRTIILYVFVVCIMRIMGKRQIGELQPFELVIAIMLSELAAVPMQDTGIPLLYGIIPILTLMLMQITLSLVTLRFQRARKIICGVPSILIKNGSVIENEMLKQRLNLDDLMEDLRMSGYLNVSDIEYAILENSGKLSIIPKFTSSPVVKKDICKNGTDEDLPIGLILDGKLNMDNLKLAGYDQNWLIKKLKAQNIDHIDDVFIAMLDSSKNLYVQRRNQNEE